MLFQIISRRYEHKSTDCSTAATHWSSEDQAAQVAGGQRLFNTEYVALRPAGTEMSGRRGLSS